MDANVTYLNESFDLQDFLNGYMGPRRIWGLPVAVTVTVVYSLILVTGVTGNVCTCLVIIKNSYMHTATNYYLFSLAISDVLTLILGKFLPIFYWRKQSL